MVAVVLLVNAIVAVRPMGETLSDAAWVLTYTADWKRAFIEDFGGSLFFSHMWSLAVEEQFYLTWPFLLWLLHAKFGPRRLAWAMCGLIAGVTVYRWWLVAADASAFRLYHAFDTRADQLLIGCALAIVLSSPNIARALSQTTQRFIPTVAVAAGLVALPLVGMLWPVRSRELPVLGDTLIAVVSATVIVELVLNRRLLYRVLSIGPLAYVGRISYGLYLWHVPVGVFYASLFHEHRPVDALAVAASSVILAAASYHAIESRVLLRWTKSAALRSFDFGRPSAVRASESEVVLA